MRRALLLTAAMCLTGCQKSFDERYQAAQEKMASQAASIDQELAVKASEAALGEAAASEAAGPAVAASGSAAHP